jgi:hypothetical protein
VVNVPDARSAERGRASGPAVPWRTRLAAAARELALHAAALALTVALLDAALAVPLAFRRVEPFAPMVNELGWLSLVSALICGLQMAPSLALEVVRALRGAPPGHRFRWVLAASATLFAALVIIAIRQRDLAPVSKVVPGFGLAILLGAAVFRGVETAWSRRSSRR